MSDETHTREEIEDARPWVQTWQSPPSGQTLREAMRALAETVRAESPTAGVLEDCCYSCQSCGRVVCADLEPNYGEQTTRPDCWADAERERHDAIDRQIEDALRAGWGR